MFTLDDYYFILVRPYEIKVFATVVGTFYDWMQ